MLLSLSLALALVTTSPEFEPVARTFVDALRRNDPGALTAGPIVGSMGSVQEILEIHKEISISSYRIASVETREESTELLIEVEGTAVSLGSQRPVPWPRWWIVEVRPEAGGWRIARAMLLERKLAADTMLSTEEERERLLRERPEIDVARYLMQLANAAANRGDDGCATLLWTLRESRARGFMAAEVFSLTLLSTLGVDRWSAPVAVPAAEEAVRLAESSQLPDALSDSYFSLGIAYWVADRLPEAIAALERSASHIGQSDDPRLQLRALYMATHLEMRQHNLRRALELAEQHDGLLALYPSRRAAMDSAFQSGRIHEAIGNLDVVRRMNESILSLAGDLRDRGMLAMALFNLSAIDSSSSEPFQAIGRIEEALELGTGTLGGDDLAAMRVALAGRLRDAGDLDRADETFAAILGTEPATEAGRNIVAAAYAGRSQLRLLQGRPEEALADARAGRHVAQAEGSTGRSTTDRPFLESLTEEGRALRALGRRDEAAAAWRAAVDLVEIEIAERSIDEAGGAAILEGKLAPYRELMSLYAEEGCVREALVIAERMRARSLRDSLRYGRIDLSAGLDDAKRQREHELETALAEVNRMLLFATDPEDVARLRRDRGEARMALRQFRSELYLANPEVGRRRADTLDQYEAWAPLISKNEVVLELAVGADCILLFTLQGTTIELQRIEISKDEIAKRVDAFVAALESRDLGYRKPARALYDLLLGPVSAQLAKAGSVRIVPDGPLWRLPFHALIDADGRHLVERLPISYSPALALSRRPTSDRTAGRALLAFANPTIAWRTAQSTRAVVRDAALGDLPEAVAEARAIARLYDDPEVKVGAEARESVFKRDAAEFRVLHLAAHSIVDDGAPMFSSIVLAAPGVITGSGESPEDGLLEAHEIADLRLHADVAILSACETARGKVTPGEGMVGLSWAFLAAGVPTTVVSQWKVGSASTADLMVHFHKSLRNGQSPAAALRKAMIDLRKNERWRHPFYWAPFVVMESVDSSGDEARRRPQHGFVPPH